MKVIMRTCRTCWKEFDPLNAFDLYCNIECTHVLHRDKEDLVNHPSHYTQWNIEVIDFIQDQKMDYLEWNCIKYISRYKYKNWVEDLRKAEFYLKKLIKSFDK